MIADIKKTLRSIGVDVDSPECFQMHYSDVTNSVYVKFRRQIASKKIGEAGIDKDTGLVFVVRSDDNTKENWEADIMPLSETKFFGRNGPVDIRIEFAKAIFEQ